MAQFNKNYFIIQKSGQQPSPVGNKIALWVDTQSDKTKITFSDNTTETFAYESFVELVSSNLITVLDDLNVDLQTQIVDLSAAIAAIVQESTTIESSGSTIIFSKTGYEYNLEVADYISKTEVESIEFNLQQQISGLTAASSGGFGNINGILSTTSSTLDIVSDGSLEITPSITSNELEVKLSEAVKQQISDLDTRLETLENISGGGSGGVETLNSLGGSVTLSGGEFVSITDNGQDTITIDVTGVTYTNLDPSVIEVGGIEAGTIFNNITFGEFVDALLYPELFPTLTGPSRNFSSSQTGFREIGEVLTIEFTATFNRGSINPQYQSTSPFRSGPPNTYNYTGTGIPSTVSSTSLSDSQTINSYEVLSGGQSWSMSVSYDAGVQPLGSKGTLFDFPLSAGTTNTITRTITGVYPYFATTSNITTMTKRPLTNHGSTVTTEMVGESGGDKQSAEFPLVWGAITQIEQFNQFTNSWDVIPLSSFTETTIIKTINSNNVNYRKYTHNGSSIGARTLRWSI